MIEQIKDTFKKLKITLKMNFILLWNYETSLYFSKFQNFKIFDSLQ